MKQYMHLHIQQITTYLYNGICICFVLVLGCDGMRIDRRLILIGVMVIVLSMTMATQYATTQIGYRFGIVHPSEGDIRFIGSDNSSDNIRVLRVVGDNATSPSLELVFGNISAGQNKTYTAAFGIVNEENYSVHITHIEVETTDADYMIIWLHSNRSQLVNFDGNNTLVWNKGPISGHNHNDSVWTLAAGDEDISTIRNATGVMIDTPWDTAASNVRYTVHAGADASGDGGVSDFVWVQISLDIPTDATLDEDYYTGTILIYTSAATV
jgi:hypothetical protein